jgi:hypothetical protein
VKEPETKPKTLFGLPRMMVIAASMGIALGLLLVYVNLETGLAYFRGPYSSYNCLMIMNPLTTLPPPLLALSCMLLLITRRKWVWRMCITLLSLNIIVGLGWLIPSFSDMDLEWAIADGVAIVLCTLVLLVLPYETKPLRETATLVDKPPLTPSKRLKILPVTSILVVIGITVAIWVSAGSGFIYTEYSWTAWEGSYQQDKWEIESMIEKYGDNHDGELPTLGANSTVIIDGKECLIIDICTLASEINPMRTADSGADISGANNDNCDGGSCDFCQGHYIWAINGLGNVSSTCVGNGCRSTGKDGYQYVWP